MAITRSTARRTELQEAVTASPPMPSPLASPAENVPDVEESRGPIVEWCSFERSNFQDSVELLQWIDILREIRRLRPGCIKVLQQDHVELAPIFFVIEWRDGKARRLFLKSEASRRFTQAFEGDHVKRIFLMRPPYFDGDPYLNGGNLWEIFTVYLPTGLSQAATQEFQWIKPESLGLGAIMSGYEIRHPLENPYEGLHSTVHGWADGIVEYRGQPARRMIYFFQWLDELAQQIFKQEAVIKRPGWTIGTSMELFLIDLEEQGMLGYETQNIRFRDVLGFYQETDSGYIKGVNDFDAFRN